MKKFLAITLLMAAAVTTASAQTFLEHLQDKQAKGNVTVKQAKAIDDLVNGKTPLQPAKTTPAAASNEKKKETAEPSRTQSSTNTHHSEQPRLQDNKAKADVARTAQQREREEARRSDLRKAPSSDSDDTIETPVVDTRKKVMRNSRKVDGYRVQAFAGGNSRTDRNKAQSIGDNIKQHYPTEPVYVHFYSPRWICRVGNYRSFGEANAMLQKVKALGYKTACIVKGKITVQY